MKKILMTGVLGLAGLWAAPGAEAQDCGRPYGYAPRSFSAYRRPAGFFYFEYRHCGRCVPLVQRTWVEAPRWEHTFAGYDCWGRPVYRYVCVPGGSWATRTVYRCGY